MKSINKKTLFNIVPWVDLLKFIVRFIIAIGIIYWLLYNHYNSFISAITRVDLFWSFIAFIFCIAVYVMGTWRWYLLLTLHQVDITFWEAFSLNMQGLFFSLVIPGGALGGDLIKGSFLFLRTTQGKRLEATSTIFMDRLLGMFSQFSIGVVSFFFCLNDIKRLNYPFKITMLMIIATSVLGIFVGIAIINHRKIEKIYFLANIIGFIDKLSKGYMSRIFKILDIYRDAKKTLFNCILISLFFVQLNISLVLIMIAKGIGVKSIPLNIFIFATSAGNTAGLLPITPSGVGTRDIIIQQLLHSAGLVVGDSLAIPLIYSFFIILISLFGGIFFVFSRAIKKRKRVSL